MAFDLSFGMDLGTLVDRVDVDGLLRLVERHCELGEWEMVLRVRDRCRDASKTGRQLWPVASHVEYRLALEAPGQWVGAALVEGAGRFALGPLPEVAAARREWSELAPHLDPGPLRAMCAHERVLRGEDLSGDDSIDPSVIELPLCLGGWERRYPLAEYSPHEAHFPFPALPPTEPIDAPPPGERSLGQLDAERALLDLARIWTTQSTGRAEVVTVEGEALSAVPALGARRIRASRLEPGQALAVMAWTAASGGAHGRRAGMAVGRFAAWWAAAHLAGIPVDSWPLDPELLGAEIARLDWWRWDAFEPDTGWVCRLAVADPRAGLAWAFAAADAF